MFNTDTVKIYAPVCHYIDVDRFDDRQLRIYVCLLLTAVTAVSFLGVIDCGFINFDDNKYVTENPHVLKGLSFQNIKWAFTSTHAANWHPFTWLSLMLDADFWGRDAPGFHLTNLLLHIVNVLLLFLLLSRTTGFVWRSAFIAALFAVHPLHVESVAWVSERKDVLSTMFFLLTLLAYTGYTRQRSIKTYAPVLFLFILGLMAKPMLVTLPVILLLFDYWPLARKEPWKRLILEKTPLFMLTIASCIITCIAQESGGAIRTMEQFPLGVRAANAVTAYGWYLLKTIWPGGLAVYYPHPGIALPVWKTLLSTIFLAVVTGLILRSKNNRKQLIFGWVWYVCTLLPVIGLVQAGMQSMADRYTYIPLIGIFLAITWISSNATGKTYHRKLLYYTAAPAVIVLLAVCTIVQVSYWQDSVTLFSRTALVTKNNSVAYGNLALGLAEQGRLDDAILNYRKSLSISPNNPVTRCNLAVALIRLGKLDEATKECHKALLLQPNSSDAYNNLGVIFAKQARFEQASKCFSKVLELEPDKTSARLNLRKLHKIMENNLHHRIPE